MNGAVEPEIPDEKTVGLEHMVNEPASEPETPDEAKIGSLMRPEKLAEEIQRFSGLSNELTEVLSRLSREVRAAAEQLAQVRSTLDAKNKELKAIYGLEASVATLEELVREKRQQKEEAERQMELERTAWEQEKARREQEERQYLENLRIRRQRDEEEYKQRWAAEKLKAQQKLEEELRVIQQEALKRQQALERDCLDRELKLKEKELEWVQLIQELEQFMSKLTRRTQAQTAAYSDLIARESAPSGQPAEPAPAVPSDSPAADPLAKPETISSLKEMLVSQGRRIETLNSEPPGKP